MLLFLYVVWILLVQLHMLPEIAFHFERFGTGFTDKFPGINKEAYYCAWIVVLQALYHVLSMIRLMSTRTDNNVKTTLILLFLFVKWVVR